MSITWFLTRRDQVKDTEEATHLLESCRLVFVGSHRLMKETGRTGEPAGRGVDVWSRGEGLRACSSFTLQRNQQEHIGEKKSPTIRRGLIGLCPFEKKLQDIRKSKGKLSLGDKKEDYNRDDDSGERRGLGRAANEGKKLSWGTGKHRSKKDEIIDQKDLGGRCRGRE